MQNDVRRVVDALPGFVWTARPDGEIDFLNRHWCDYIGIASEDVGGDRWWSAVHPDDLPALLDPWRSSVAGGEPLHVDARIRGAAGGYRWFTIVAGPLRDAGGRIVAWCGVGTEIEERKRAEESVRMNELSLHVIVESIPGPVAVTTADGEVEYVNQPLRDYFGKTLEELKQWKASDVHHPEDLPRVIEAWSKAVASGSPHVIQGRLRRADGVYRWFEARGFPLRNSEGRIVRWCLLHTDFEDRKRAETLLAGEKRLLEMVAGGHSLRETLAELCRLVESNGNACRCGVFLIDANGTWFDEAVSPSMPASFIAAMTGRPVAGDSTPSSTACCRNEQVIAADLTGETRWASDWLPMALAHGVRACWSTPFSSSAGKVLGAFAIYYDEPRAPTLPERNLIEQFTSVASIAVERAQSDAALTRSGALLEEGERLSSTGTFSWRVATDEIAWTAELYRIFEFEQGTPVTLERIGSRVHPDDIPLLMDMIARARGDGGDFEYQHRLLMPDGSVKHVHLIGHATRDADGKLEYIGAAQDVTEHQLSEQALGKARSELAHVARVASLGVLTASIAHEVNQPLSGIITNASTCLRMLSADPPNIDGAVETARRTIRDGHRASDVIARLRALFGRKTVTIESMDLNEATREVLALSSSELGRNRVTVRAELADDLPPVAGDRVQLQQVILNLLLNAMDAMSGVDDRPRQLLIRTECEEDEHVRMTVQDAGSGLDTQDVDRVFEAFYTTKSDGMGMGLSISRSIIESHHGRLWAERNDGPGATFAFSIPLYPRTVAQAAPTPKYDGRSPWPNTSS